jgi:hypothetical protein
MPQPFDCEKWLEDQQGRAYDIMRRVMKHWRDTHKRCQPGFEVELLAGTQFRAILRRRPLRSAMKSAGNFAARFAICVFIALPLCIVVLVVPLGILNLIGIMAFRQEFYWPLIAPGLFLTYALSAAAVYWAFRASRRKHTA